MIVFIFDLHRFDFNAERPYGACWHGDNGLLAAQPHHVWVSIEKTASVL
jgi:hypothetical protein